MRAPKTLCPPPLSCRRMVLGVFELVVFVLGPALLAGLAGSVLGVGGGIFLVPYLTLMPALRLPLPQAIATSLVGVIATSSGAASVYVRDRLTNLRLGMFLEVATTLGAIVGALVAVYVNPVFLFIAFGGVVAGAAAYMLHTKEGARDRAGSPEEETGLAARLRLSSMYFDPEDRAVYRYRVTRPMAGFAASAVAGGVSGLLGVGGGFIKVPAMNVMMRVPMKVAIATSNFMIGVTAAASALIYYSRGLVDPSVASMVIVGVFLGTLLGTRILVRVPAREIRVVFAVLLIGVSVAMIAKGVGVLP